MHYSKIVMDNGTGFTNQIFSLITSILIAHTKGDKIVVVDHFLNDAHNLNPTYTPISDIFNLSSINTFLKQQYDIIIVDKYNIQFELIHVYYGTNDHRIDLTDNINQQYFKNNNLCIHKNFNEIQGDPCPGIVKKMFIKYKLNDYFFEETYHENSNIEIHFNGPYTFNLGWTTSYNDNMFDKILQNITYKEDFITKSILTINSNKINVIHLRLEDDGIKHWSNVNKMSPSHYKSYLENKYIHIIQTYVTKTDENIIISNSSSNEVIHFLNQHQYKYTFIHKFFKDREKNAIVDLLASKYCNHIFIGNFNIKNQNGSTFSYYVWKTINDRVTKIYIDLDHIHDKEVII